MPGDLRWAPAAKANDCALDLPNAAFATKELARGMAFPTGADWARLETLGRCLKGRPRFVLNYDYQDIPDNVTTYADSDWVVCTEPRQSTSGVLVLLGKYSIKPWSTTQATCELAPEG